MRLGKVSRHDSPRPAQLDLPQAFDDVPFVVIAPKVLNEMFHHAQEGFPLEIAGYVLGRPYVDIVSEQQCTVIEHLVHAQCISTRTHVTLLPSGLIEVQQVCDRTGMILVGYYHSHPGFSVFQSGEDLRTYSEYYPESYQIAIVVDPTRIEESDLHPGGEWIGFFGWDASHTAKKIPAEQVLPLSASLETRAPGTQLEVPGGPSNLEDSSQRAQLTEVGDKSDSQRTFSLGIDVEIGNRAWKKTLQGSIPKLPSRTPKDPQ
jgi:proteasome lid subunit RPN8/RPN11